MVWARQHISPIQYYWEGLIVSDAENRKDFLPISANLQRINRNIGNCMQRSNGLKNSTLYQRWLYRRITGLLTSFPRAPEAGIVVLRALPVWFLFLFERTEHSFERASITAYRRALNSFGAAHWLAQCIMWKTASRQLYMAGIVAHPDACTYTLPRSLLAPCHAPLPAAGHVRHTPHSDVWAAHIPGSSCTLYFRIVSSSGPEV